MSSEKNSEKYLRIPPWLRVKLPTGRTFNDTSKMLDDLDLNTVCQSAKCPNCWECFSRKVATFLIMGNNCTRDCAFCNICPGQIEPLDADEPRRVAEAVTRLGLKYAVITSVTRDDLDDGGAAHFAETIERIRTEHPECKIEVLIPDFQGNLDALKTVIAAKPDVINHNVETPPELYSEIRPQADYKQSLELIERVKQLSDIHAKSGLMVGLGETDEQVYQVIDDLAAINCDIITIGQYMRPSKAHPAVKRYVEPAVFDEYAEYGKKLNVPHMFCAPLVRSSFNAAEAFDKL
ncbi:lipoyl synthase [Maridesulfovibrio salexigens]|uniref:Lipoyl synthase n=1 Tax=Maridesulfovibrio salexigens (strain ATCC 14822 / DSM 2638 / NCIMB 8403 / VKM B-1763) TaxID=526222 RepID=C6BZY7_MARSD|nr:lipoyl synthase [Maridesulfovibrio salexigens]ACS80858.1 lipoic acid synthetase [Maridesulfovibrio salexigens DSM 2638]